ncbi:PIN domain-containing protein [Jiangella gansuensis]|uniref:PIN domain-containing protein n=1 Tax=Jiangella gansuensis TaxID=281473 RepID=UPI0004BBCE36|nr:PIN domain-containing protein [Jiangella gansuensis]
MKYLIDTSGLVRLLRRQVAVEWHETVARGMVAICEPTVIETMSIADAKRYRQVEAGLRAAHPWVYVPDDAWERIRSDRAELAAHSAHQGLSVADHLVVTTARYHRMTLLHEDADFETAARLLPDLTQRRITAGPA